MLDAEILNSMWNGEGRNRAIGRIFRRPAFTEQGLELGAQTVIARALVDGNGRPRLDLQADRGRARGLLGVAYHRSIDDNCLQSLTAASEAWQKGDLRLAYIALAQGGFGDVGVGDDAPRRLYAAEKLLDWGLGPQDLSKCIALIEETWQFEKASANDPLHPGWPAGTPGGVGGQFRPKDSSATGAMLPGPLPIVDFSGGFHDVVVNTWMDYFKKIGTPAVKQPSIRLVGPNNSVIGAPDMVVNLPGKGLTIVEVKTGDDPPLTPNQMWYIPMLQIGGHVYSNDPRIRDLGLVPGQPFPPMHVIILFAPGPGKPYDAIELPPPKIVQ